jgi:hypothetical protein
MIALLNRLDQGTLGSASSADGFCIAGQHFSEKYGSQTEGGGEQIKH